MKKTFIFGVLLAAAITLHAAETNEKRLNGGKLVPVSLTMIEAAPYHLNFCFATRFSDGTIYLNHSTGIHTVTEKGCRDISTDNGATWQKSPSPIAGMNAFETLNKMRRVVGCWESKPRKEHDFHIFTFDGDNRKIDEKKFQVVMPYITSCLLHRDIKRTSDGRLLLTGYGYKEGANKFHNFLLESKDDGLSWNFVSVIAEDPAGEFPEGPCETGIEVLSNDEILAVYRVGSTSPMFQKRSTDGGATWSDAVKIASYSAAPSLLRLNDGTLVLIAGRPRLYLMVDFSGTGKHWQDVAIYNHHATSSYASVLETTPGELLVIYDESDFGSWRNPSPFHRIMGARFNLVKDDSIRAEEEAGPGLYSAKNQKYPEDMNIRPIYYKRKSADPNGKATYEIIEIAERPDPVLRVVSHGDNAPAKFAHFKSPEFPENTTRATVEFEFRLLDANVKTAQFMVNSIVEHNGQNWIAWVSFAQDKIIYLTEGKKPEHPYNIGLGFRSFILEADGKAGTYTLFTAKDKQKVLSGKLTKTENRPQVQFGDGTSTVYGSFDLFYFSWKYEK
jgi:hypothetical protein